MGGGRHTRAGATPTTVLFAHTLGPKYCKSGTGRFANQLGNPRMDNLRSVLLGVLSSLIAAGIIALARNKDRLLRVAMLALALANLPLCKMIARWLIKGAALFLPNYARERFRE